MRGLGLGAWVAGLPLGRLLAWLAGDLKQCYRERRAIDLGQPLPLPEGLQL